MTRTPYYVTARCILTGADISRVLYLRSPAMAKYLPRDKHRWSRLVSVAVATPDQIEAHHARLWRAAQ